MHRESRALGISGLSTKAKALCNMNYRWAIVRINRIYTVYCVTGLGLSRKGGCKTAAGITPESKVERIEQLP